MIKLVRLGFVCFFIGCWLTETRGQEKGLFSVSKGDETKFVKEFELIRYGDKVFPSADVRNSKWFGSKNPTETNEVGSADDEGRSVVIFRTYEAPQQFLQPPPVTLKALIGIRKKRDAILDQIPESSLIGKLRPKRKCRKCKDDIVYAIPVQPVYVQAVQPVQPVQAVRYVQPVQPIHTVQAVQPVQPVQPAYYGGGGCHSCGAQGGGGGGSFSFSSSSSQSSSGSFGGFGK